VKGSWVHEELHGVRNIRPSFKWGLLPFLAYSALDTYILRGKAPWTLQHHEPDHLCTKVHPASPPPHFRALFQTPNAGPQPASECTKIDYPKPDGVLSFDLLSNLARSGTAVSDRP